MVGFWFVGLENESVPGCLANKADRSGLVSQNWTPADDVLSFNPFHCLPEHLPLGSINRVRIKAYESSAKYRHLMNATPRTEPTDISQLPD